MGEWVSCLVLLSRVQTEVLPLHTILGHLYQRVVMLVHQTTSRNSRPSKQVARKLPVASRHPILPTPTVKVARAHTLRAAQPMHTRQRHPSARVRFRLAFHPQALATALLRRSWVVPAQAMLLPRGSHLFHRHSLQHLRLTVPHRHLLCRPRVLRTRQLHQTIRQPHPISMYLPVLPITAPRLRATHPPPPTTAHRHLISRRTRLHLVRACRQPVLSIVQARQITARPVRLRVLSHPPNILQPALPIPPQGRHHDISSQVLCLQILSPQFSPTSPRS